MKLRFLPAVVTLLSLLAPAAHGTVLVYEGFHPADYNNVAATGNIEASTTFTAGHTIGIASSKWNKMNGTQIRVFGENYGLALPQAMTDFGFTATGGSIGCNPSSDNTDMRAMNHALASGALHASAGTNLYVRMLLNLDATAAGKLTARSSLVGNAGNYYACGFCMAPSGNDYHLLTHTRSAIAFLLWKNTDNQYVLSFGHTTAAEATATFYPLVTGITLGETYVCYAEIQVDAGTGGNEIVRAGAVAASDFTGAAPWVALGGESDSVETQLISASAYPTVMAVAGPYGTKPGYFRADEIVAGTEKKDILPVGGVFAVSPAGTPTVETNAFSTAWILVADEGVTANAGLVWSMDASFATATTNSLGAGLAAGTRTASLSNLEPGMTYWWKIVADNGTEVAETTPASFTTPGAPIIGTATVTATGESAAFSVALAEAAMLNTLATSVSVFYGTNGVDWTELQLGTASVATNCSGIAESLGYGETYQWFARATATLEGGRTLLADSATNSFMTLWSGDIYVDAAAANAVIPYSTPETAAKTIAAALTVADAGATIHVAPGRYNISSPITINKAVHVTGDENDPSRVVVTNTKSSFVWGSSNRCFGLNHADAFLSGLSLENGYSYGSAGNLLISANGGTVSNCIIRGGFAREANQGGSGANVSINGPGLVTHCTIVGGMFDQGGNTAGSSSVFLDHANARLENCLVDGYRDQISAGTRRAAGVTVNKGRVVNCTVVNCYTTAETGSSFSGVRVESTGIATNCVSVGNYDGSGTLRAFRSASGALLVNCAYDRIAGETNAISGMVSPVVGTAAEFFPHHAENVPYAVKYRPASGGLLADKGANYEPMALYDLSGEQKRKVGARVDIGCYEANAAGTVIIVK
jgi:hypothetical protein